MSLPPLSHAFLPVFTACSTQVCFPLTVSASEQALQPNEGEVEELRGHVVIAGFGRVGQIIGQLLSERLIPFVALDVRSDRVQVCSHNRTGILSLCGLLESRV